MPDETVLDTSTPTPEGPLSPQIDMPSVADDTDSENAVITLSRRELHKEIERLQREDPDFSNAFNTLVGRKAAARYRPQLEELNARNRILERTARAAEIRAMPNEEIERRYQSDPQFAREYTEIVHGSTNAGQAELEAAQMATVFAELVDDAMGAGLSQSQVEKYTEAVRQGAYDKDEEGRPYAHWAYSLARLQREMMKEATRSAPTLPAQADRPSESSGGSNPNLNTPGPDTNVGRSARPSARPKYRNATEAAQLFTDGRITADEYRRAKETLGW